MLILIDDSFGKPVFPLALHAMEQPPPNTTEQPPPAATKQPLSNTMEKPLSKALASINAFKTRLNKMDNSVERVTPPWELLASDLRFLKMLVDKDIYVAFNSPTQDGEDQDIAARIAQFGYDRGVKDTILKNQYRESAKERHLAYEKSLRLHLVSYCVDVLELVGQTIGPSQAKAHLERLFPCPANQSTSNDSEQPEQHRPRLGGSSTSETIQETASQVAHAQTGRTDERGAHGQSAATVTTIQENTTSDSTSQAAATSTTIAQSNTTETSGREPPSNESATSATRGLPLNSPETHVTPVESTAPTVPQRANDKRPVSTSPDDENPAKRPRTEQTRQPAAKAPPPPQRPSKSIGFDEVYGNGNAVQKYIIVQSNGKFYILRCEKCGKFFNNNPLHGASIHVGKSHKDWEKHSNVVEVLGVRVRNCNTALMKTNNDRATAHFRSEKKQRQSSAGRSTAAGTSSGARRSFVSLSGRAQRGTGGIADPIPGRVYQVFWEQKHTYGVLMLRMGDFEGLGVEGSVESVHLAPAARIKLPVCYARDVVTGTFAWKEGYEDNGPLVMKRWFPVMFFEGHQFPENGEPGFVSADLLQPFDKSDPEIKFRRTVLKFMNEHPVPAAGDIVPASRASRGMFSFLRALIESR